jgi:hypothetical protein
MRSPCCLYVCMCIPIWTELLAASFSLRSIYKREILCVCTFYQPTFLILKKKTEVGLCDHHAFCVLLSVYPPYQHLNA